MTEDPPKPDAPDPRAPVIDLEAEVVKDPAEEPPPPPPPPPKPRSQRSWRAYGATAAVVLAALAGAWLYRGYGTSLWPTDAMRALETRVEALDTGTRAVHERLEGLAGTVDTLKSETQGLADGLNAAKSQSEEASRTALTAGDAAAAIAQRLDRVEASLKSSQSAVDEIKRALAAGTGGTVTVAPADTARLDALETRIVELEKTVASLKSGSGAGGGAEAATLLSQALSDLKAKFAAGAPFEPEFERIAALVPAAPGLDLLGGHAKTGLANATGLAAELGRIAAALPAPTPEPAGDGGTWSWILEGLGSIVTVRKIGETDWRAVALKAKEAADRGDLREAIGIVTAAEGELPAPLSRWIAGAKARLAAEAALEEVAAAVLRQIAALGKAP